MKTAENPAAGDSGWFEDGADRGRILASGRDTGGLYSLMEWIVGAGMPPHPDAPPSYGVHRHRQIEETFYVKSGALEFLLGDQISTLKAGDFVRVAPGVRHGYANVSGAEVELLVSFHPGGFEELFLKYRTDHDGSPQGDGFVADATRLYDSEFETP
jgi:mannose-6-phosphate isomerase-like protein (cupin superfamily)